MNTINGKSIPAVIGSDNGTNSLFLFDVRCDSGEVACVRVWAFSMGSCREWRDIYGITDDRVIAAR